MEKKPNSFSQYFPQPPSTYKNTNSVDLHHPHLQIMCIIYCRCHLLLGGWVCVCKGVVLSVLMTLYKYLIIVVIINHSHPSEFIYKWRGLEWQYWNLRTWNRRIWRLCQIITVNPERWQLCELFREERERDWRSERSHVVRFAYIFHQLHQWPKTSSDWCFCCFLKHGSQW